MTRAEYDAYEVRVGEFFSHGLNNLSASHYKCPECAVIFDCQECPECGKDAGEFPVEPYFSGCSCPCCGTSLAGDRYDCNGFNGTTGEVEEYEGVCQDCVYYAEYGQLDDQTMLDIEASEGKYCKCGEELDQDCMGNPRCPVCDPPCPCCDDGGMDTQEDQQEREDNEPQEGDYTSSDHLTWVQYGELVLDLESGEDFVTALKDHMKHSNFFPSAWWISDHGNAHKIDLS